MTSDKSNAPEIPANPAPKPTPAAAPEKSVAETKPSKSAAVWMGTAVGVGSAAIVAALLYSKRRP